MHHRSPQFSAPHAPSGPAAPRLLGSVGRLLVPTLLALLGAAPACNSVSGVQEVAPTAGLHATLEADLPGVQEAAALAISANQLNVKAVTREGDTAWVVVASRGMTSSSYGELIRVRAVRRDSAETEVWIYEELRMTTNVAAKRDWSETLLADIRDEVKAAGSFVPPEWVALRAGLVTVLDISIPPGDTTPFHTHNAAVVYVPLAVSATDAQPSGGAWGAAGPESASRLQVGVASSDLLYANRPLTHRVANIGAGEFRVLEIVNGSSAGVNAPLGTLPGELGATSSWFRLSRLVLEADKRTRWYSAELPVVVIVPERGVVTVEREAPNIAYDAPPSVTLAPGGWTLIPAGARYRLQGDTTEASTVIAVQVRQKSSAPAGTP